MIWILLIVSLAVIVAVALLSLSSKMTTGILENSQQYKIYYGAPDERLINQMKGIDLLIVEPYHYNKGQIQRIQSRGSRVYGYISVMEAAAWNKKFMDQLRAGDYFYRNGKKVYFPKWDSYLMDITSVHYQDLLLEEIRKQIMAKRFDGIFLDTVGDIDDQHAGDPDTLSKQRQGLVMFYRKVKKLAPHLPLIQNWGFETLQKATIPYVQGIMWEDFNYSTVSNNPWSLEQMDRLQQLRRKYDLTVFTVSNREARKSTRYSKRRGFVHYHDSNGYQRW